MPDDLWTRLDRMEDNLKAHVDQRFEDKLGPMQRQLNGQGRTLYGDDGNGGIARDVNRLKWVVGIMTSGLAAAAYWVKDHLPFLKGGG